MVAAIPREMFFSEPALPTPRAGLTRALSVHQVQPAAEARSQPPPRSQQQPRSQHLSEERDTYWVGSPVRHHVNALRGLLQLRTEGIPNMATRTEAVPDGGKVLLDFLHALCMCMCMCICMCMCTWSVYTSKVLLDFLHALCMCMCMCMCICMCTWSCACAYAGAARLPARALAQAGARRG